MKQRISSIIGVVLKKKKKGKIKLYFLNLIYALIKFFVSLFPSLAIILLGQPFSIYLHEDNVLFSIQAAIILATQLEIF